MITLLTRVMAILEQQKIEVIEVNFEKCGYRILGIATTAEKIMEVVVEAALLVLPGGTHCDPQEVADLIRSLRRPDAAPTARADADAIWNEAIDACKRAAVTAWYGAPSNWGGGEPRGWHLSRPCTPHEAAMHDNGVNDAIKAILAIRRSDAAPARERPGLPSVGDLAGIIMAAWNEAPRGSRDVDDRPSMYAARAVLALLEGE